MTTDLAEKKTREIDRSGRDVPLEPAPVTPAQFYDRAPLDASLQPERRLMLAVLEEAIATYMRHAPREDAGTKAEFREAAAWIAEEELVWPFSFVNICRALGLEPDFVRRGLADWRERQLRLAPERRTRIRNPFRRMNGTRTKTRGRAPGLHLVR